MAHNCKTCNFRAKYDNKPESILGRLWKWHTGWCPGWRRYMKSLPDAERIVIADQYKMEKFK